jgi:hypothetical protein
MATFTWYSYNTAGSSVTVGSSTFVFSGSATDLTVPVTVAAWQDGIHIGTGDPGTDQCGGNHINNTKFIAVTQYQLNGGGTETLNDTSLLTTECPIYILFNESPAVTTSNARFYCFNSTVATTRATGVDVYAYERGVAYGSGWTKINDDSGSTGGDNSGHRLDLGAQGSATNHSFYIAISVSPESVGGKGDFDLGIALTYS